MDKKSLIVGIVFFLIGIALGVYSYFSIKSYNEKDKTYIETNSVVVDYKHDYDTDNNQELLAIIVEYEVDGRKYRLESDSYSTITKSIGENVLVKYNPANPSDAIFKNESKNIIVPITSVLFVIGGIALIVKVIKER